MTKAHFRFGTSTNALRFMLYAWERGHHASKASEANTVLVFIEEQPHIATLIEAGLKSVARAMESGEI